MKKPRTSYIANENEAPEGTVIQCFGNASTDLHGTNGWVLLAPYGNWPNADGLQKFERSDAEAIVGSFNSIANTVSRFLGLPWYVGHPDHPAFAQRFRDTSAKGRVKTLEVRDDGLWANVKWNEEGKKLITEEAFHGHSVNWKVRKDGAGWRPFSLKSVGFTNEPNIPVPPIMVANEKRDMNLLEKLLKILGLAKDAAEEKVEQVANAFREARETYEAIVAAVNLEDPAKRSEALTTIANERKSDPVTPFLIATIGAIATANASVDTLTKERDAANAKLIVLEPKATKLEGEVTLANSKASTLETSFANERKERIAILIANGIRDGKITPATREQWEKDLANSFDDFLPRLAAAPVVVKTTSEVGRHAERNTVIRNSTDKAAHVAELANVHIKAGMSSADAYARVYREHPELAVATAA